MKKQAVLKISGILLALALVATAVCLAVTRGQNSGSSNSVGSISKKVYEGHPSLAWTSLLERCQRAQYIIYIVDGSNNFQPGDRAIIFVNEYKGPFSAYCQHVLNGDPILLPPDQFEGLGIPEEYSKDEYGNVLFTEDEFVDYVTGIVKSLE